MKTSFLGLFKLILATAAGAGLLVGLNFDPVKSAVKNAAYSALGPVQRAVWIAGAGVYGFFEPFAKMNGVAEENEKMAAQINDLLAKTVRISDLEKENDLLRQGLNLELDKDFDLKLADIIAKDVAKDILVINKGAKDMVEEGMPVITAQRGLVGKISKVYENFSEVSLITNKDFSFDVRIGDGGVDGLVKGQGNYGATLGLVSRDKTLRTDDPVYTSAMGGIFPAGLLIGTIKEINRNDVETFQSAALTLAFDASGSSQIFIANAKIPLELESVRSNKQ